MMFRYADCKIAARVMMVALAIILAVTVAMPASAGIATTGSVASGGFVGEAIATSQSINMKYFMTVPTSGKLVVYDDFFNSTTTVSLGGRPWDLDVYENGGSPKVYISDKDNFRVFVVNGVTNALITSVTVGNTPIGVAVDNTRSKVFVCNYVSNHISVIDATTDGAPTLISKSGMTKPYGAVVNEVTDRLYVSSYDTNKVYVFESSTGNYVTVINTFAKPTNLAVNEDDNKVYVVHDGNAYLTVINGATNVATGRSLSAGAQDVAYLPDLNWYFVAAPGADKVLVFDAQTDASISDAPLSLPAGTGPRGIAVMEDGMTGGNEPWYAVTANGTGKSMSEIVIYDTYKPAFEGLISAVDAEDPVTPSVILSWGDATDDSAPISYNIYVAIEQGGFDFDAPASGTTTSTGTITFATTGIDWGDELWFLVRAKDSSLVGNQDQNEVQFKVKVTDGAAPVGGDILTAVDTMQGREVVLTWSAGVDTTAPVTYNIYRALSSGAYNWNEPYYSTQGVTTYTAKGLDNDTTYFFSIRAEDGAGLENSNVGELSVTPTDTAAPVFAGLQSLADDMAGGAINMSWLAASDNSGPVKYNVYYEQGAALSSWATAGVVVTGQTSYRLTGLTNNLQYTVGVRAEDTAGNEDGNLTTFTVTPTDSIAPSFAGASACQDKGTGSGIQVSWQNATDNSTPVSYNIYMATASGTVNYNFASWSYQTQLTTYTATGLTPGQDYWFIVRAEDAASLEENNEKQVGSCVPTDGGNPVFNGAKTAAATGVTGEILIGWDAATDSSSPITYNVYQSLVSGVYAATPSYQVVGSTSTTVTGLIDGTTYYFRVRAQDTGKREEKNTKQVSAKSNDGTPPVFAGIATLTDAGTYGALNVSWVAAVDASPPPITYNVYVATTAGGQNFSSPSKTTTGTSVQLTNLTNGQIYYVVVRAVDSGGVEDTNVIELSATPMDKTGPSFAGLTDVTNTQAGGEIKLRWSAASDQSAPITYLIYMEQGTSAIDFSTPSYTTTATTYYIEGLTNAAQYYFSVGARDGASPANTSTNTVILPGIPTDAQAPAFNGVKSAASAQNQSKTISLAWDAATDNTEPITYKIYYSTNNNSAVIVAGGVKATTTQLMYDISVASNGVYYYFVVRASDGYGNTDTNIIVKGAVPNDYSVPAFLGLDSVVDTGKGGEAELSWSEATDESAIVYDIYYSTATSSLTTTARATVTGLTYKVSGLTNNTLYYFAVGARDISGNKTTNNVVLSATLTDVSPPVFSTSPAVADTEVGGEILVSWGAASDNSTPITYNIYQSSSSASFDFGTPSYTAQNATSYKIAGLTDGVPLYFVVTAKDASSNLNETSVATVLSATPSDKTAPSFNGLNSATTYSENGIVLLSWSAATDRTGPITYNIYKSMTSGSYNNYSSPTYVVSGTTTYLVQGLLDTRRYYFTVRAKDSVSPTPNEDNNTNEKGITFRDQVGPNQPTSVVATGGDASPATGDEYIELTWVAPTKNADTTGTPLVDLKGYNIYRGTTLGSYPVTVNEVDGKTNGLVAATATQYIDTYQIVENTLYYYILVAVDDAADPNYSPPSDQVSAKTKNSDLAVPRPPEDLTAEAASGQVVITWTPPIFNVDGSLLTDLVGFYIWRSETQGGAYTSIAGLLPDTATFYEDDTVINDTKYYYYMTAVDGGGIESGPSLEVSATPMAPVDYPPAAPSNITASTGASAIYLSWSAPTKNSDGSTIGSDLDGYNIYKMTGTSTVATKLNVAKYVTTNYSDSSVSSGQTYKYYVTALDKAGNESASSSVAVAIIGSRGVTGRIRVRQSGETSSSGYPVVGVADLEIWLVDGAGTKVATGYTSADGTFKIVYELAVVGTPYNVRLIVKPGSGYPYDAMIDGTTGYLTLAKNLNIAASGFTNIVPEPAPIGSASTIGNIDCDDKVGIKDLLILKPAYSSVVGDPEYNQKADLNGDGAVTIKDLMVIKNYYSKKTMSLPVGACN